MYFCMYFKLTDHAFKIATHRARKEENAQSVHRHSKTEKRYEENSSFSRAVHRRVFLRSRASLFFFALLLGNGFFSLLKGSGTSDVTFARSEDDREGIFRCRLPDVGSSSTPNASAGRAVHSSRRAHSLGSSRSRPRKTRIFSFFFFLECALSLSSLVFFFVVVVVFQLKHAVEEEKPQEEKNAKDNNNNNNAGKRRRT